MDGRTPPRSRSRSHSRNKHRSPLQLSKRPSPMLTPRSPPAEGKHGGSSPRVGLEEPTESQSAALEHGSLTLPPTLEQLRRSDSGGNRSPGKRPGETRRTYKKRMQQEAKMAEPSKQPGQQLQEKKGPPPPHVSPDLFSNVEIVFCAPDRYILHPHELSQLLLWAVPAPVPLAESPKYVLIKNKSRVTDVVVIYVNGWSYDMMMCTGVGLKRSGAGAAAGQKQQQQPGGDGAGKEGKEAKEVWNERVCSSLLEPIRRQRCWAREPGVQYAPLYIPNTKDRFACDLWFRGDDQRTRGAAASSNNNNKNGSGGISHGGKQSRTVDVLDDEADDSKSRPRRTEVRGHGASLQWAREQMKKSADGRIGEASPVSSPTSLVSSPTQYAEGSSVWADRALLLSYALFLPQSASDFAALGYTRTPEEVDVEDLGAWRTIPPPKEMVEEERGEQETGRAPRVYAFDCEMVLTDDNESCLARATLVNVVSGAVALDMLVKPARPVNNYLTCYSGITKELLDPVETTLAACQDAILKIVDSDTFIVGHSLENDFKACKLFPTCRVLDSAFLFPHQGGLPHKHALRYLASRYLNKKIQGGAHDSGEDAFVSAQLVQLKLERGPLFGVRRRCNVLGIIAGLPPEEPTRTFNAGPQERRDKDEGEGEEEVVAPPPPPVPVHIELFDDPDTLNELLPRKTNANRVDAISARGDEDATRRAVRALARRAQLRRQRLETTGEATVDADFPFSLTWLQLRETGVDVVEGPEGGSALERERYAAEQLARSRAVNRRVLRVVQAAADNAVVLVACGDCRGEEGGNHFSKAHGACFAFVKDSTARAPDARLLEEDKEEEAGSKGVSGGEGETTAVAATA